MTWGEIESTPFRLDGSDTPYAERNLGPSFKVNNFYWYLETYLDCFIGKNSFNTADINDVADKRFQNREDERGSV